MSRRVSEPASGRAGDLRFVWVSVVQTLLRVLPFPCRTGLVRIGHPGRDSPVLLTGNFGLTVERVRRALRGADAYLLIANSRGVNVWCAATGGHLTHHDVVSVLKTSGVEELVDHREVILPQLAATGIEARIVHRKSGWKVRWGPARAAQIPAYLERGRVTDGRMRTVTFPWTERLEMAVAWAFPMSLLALLVLPLWKAAILPLVSLVWGLAFLIFLSFPLYQERLRRRPRGERVGFVLFDFGERGVPLVAWVLFMAFLTGGLALGGTLTWLPVLRWGSAALVVLLILSLDLTGSTPLYKSGLHADRLLEIRLDLERCRGAAFCEDTCPVGVFVVDPVARKASLPGAERCVQCGACVVQCPFDALFFRSPGGEVVPPETVRRFRLNLLGRRAVPIAPDSREGQRFPASEAS